MPALTFGIPNTPKVYCDNWECDVPANIEFRDVHNKAVGWACNNHSPAIQLRSKDWAAVKLRRAGDPTSAEKPVTRYADPPPTPVVKK